MTTQERKEEKPYATIYQLRLGESTRIDVGPAADYNDYNVYKRSYQVTRVPGGWIYSREFANNSMDTFVPDTRPAENQTLANRPRE